MKYIDYMAVSQRPIKYMLRSIATINALSLLLLSLLLHTSLACTSAQFSFNGACVPCHVTCLTCTSWLATSCLTCPSTRTLNAIKSCQCNSGFVEASPVVASCTALVCSYTCLTCNNTAATCTSCSSANFRVLVAGTSTCPCQGKYYDAGAALCAACHHTCTTCSNSAAADCLTCDSANAFRSLSATSCPCLPGYFDALAYVCSPCSYRCATCSVSLANCLTCGANRGAAPSCLALQGYYDNAFSTDCPQCHYSCQNCSDGVSCNVCNAAAYRAQSSLTPLCGCMSRYFDAGVTTCSACDPRCFTCLSLTVCLTCNPVSYRIFSSSTQFCVCMTGYYETSSSVQLCAACSSRCLTCQGTTTNCTTCDPSMNRVLSGNTCPCATGFYQNAFVTCSACHSSCYTCTTSTACTGCVASSLMTLNSSNLCSCASTMFYNTTLNVCQTCNYQCATCVSTSPTVCMSCAAGSQRTFASSACPCNIYYYDNGASTTCAACSYTCRTCSGPAASNCLNCTSAAKRFQSGSSCLCQTLYYDNGALQLCQPCMYNCLTCTDGSSCSSCNATLYRTLNTAASPNTCSCSLYYFERNQLCVGCVYSCLTCNTLTTCLTCDPTTNFRTFNTATTLCDCLPGYYDNFVDRTCLACLPQCYTCTNATTCTSCSAAAFRSLTATFLCPCDSDYFDVSGVCTGCLYSCATCTSPSTCSTCNSAALRLLNNNNLCACASNYYDDGTHEQCQSCSYACLTCVSTANQCTTCDTTLRSMVSNWCACAQHYYDNNVTVACSQCQYTCSSCLRANNCSTCDSAKYREFDSINQYCICNRGYYDNGMDETCPACNYRCYTCTNSSQCLTCSGSWFRATPASMCPCLNGYYDDGSSSTCQTCHYTCSTCTNGSQCLTCDLTTNRRTFNTNYLCSCINRYYDDTFSNQLCLPCVYSCLTCAVVTANCTSCTSTAYRVLTGGQCLCQQHYYDNLAELCLPCHYTCSTCTAPDKCATCNATSHRLAATTGLCACANMFWDDGSNQLCQPCESTCFTCLSTASCVSCNNTRNRLLNSTVDFFGVSSPFCVCLYRYYSPASNQNCLPCHYSCQVCTGGTSESCVFCTASALRLLNTKTSTCDCADGYYDNGLVEQCQTCNSACTLCSTGLPNSCTACSPLYYHLVAATTCYSSCPAFYYNYQVDWTCQACSANCQTCVNGSYCSSCANSNLLYLNKCVPTCPGGTYAVASLAVCLNCPTGCFNCSGNSACFSCFTGYYFNSSLGFCFQCNSVCTNCTGPGQKECTACSAPLFLSNNTCSLVTCSSGSYLDPALGCLSCGSLFLGSLLCNNSQAISCSSSFLLLNSTCTYCSQVPGYELSQGECVQICGDALLIYLQCDDGNKQKGDGCSEMCTIEQGWNCFNNATSGSVCSLIQPPTITLKSATKVFGVNLVIIELELSIPIAMNDEQMVLDVQGIDSSQYRYTVVQSATNLSRVSIYLNYTSSVQGTTIDISYSSTRRMQEDYPVGGGRALAGVSFSSSISLSTYPPANYYSSSVLAQFNLLQTYITTCAVALLVLSLIIVPRRTHLHGVTLVYLPTQIFVSYCLVPSGYTDWVQYTLQNLKQSAMFGGFSMGLGGQTIYSHFGVTSQVTAVAGIVAMVLVGSWVLLALLYLFNTFCLKVEEKFKVIRYFAFTLNLALSFIIVYAAMNALYDYKIATKTDAFNTIFAILLNILFVMALIALWARSYQIQSLSNRRDSKVFSMDQTNVIFNMPPIDDKNHQKQSHLQVDGRSEAETYGQRFSQTNSQLSQKKDNLNTEFEPFVHDYYTLYRHTKMVYEQGRNISYPTKSKYFLPLLLTKIYLTAALSSLMRSAPIPYFILLSVLQLTFSLFLLTVRPFQSTFTNFRLILISLTLIATNVVMCMYLYDANQLRYSLFDEQLIIYLVLGLVGAGAVFAGLQQVLAWRRQIWRKVFEPCLKGTRLMGTRIAVFEPELNHSELMGQSQFRVSSSSSRRQENGEEEMDAFYARMLKKEQLNKKYKRERMIR